MQQTEYPDGRENTVVNLPLKSNAELDAWIQHIQLLHYRTMDLTLDRVGTVIDRITSGSIGFKVISVAGTNGKGSVATMLESIFRHAGYRTGLYTSPHLVHFSERFVVDGRVISNTALLEEFRRVEEKRGSVPLTFFEYGTAIAIDYFMRESVDVAILEVGLGGRKDAVNTLEADIACITSIGIDHEKWLGNTREQIGYEKAGILRSDQLAVCTDTDLPESIRKVAADLSLDLLLNGEDFDVDPDTATWNLRFAANRRESDIFDLPYPYIAGRCQRDNAAGAATVAVMARKFFDIPDESIRLGLQNARLEGRLQVVQHNPQVLLDVAHNIESVNELKRYLSSNPVAGREIALMSVLSEKPIEVMADCIRSSIDEWHLCGIHDERGITARKLFRRVHPVLGDDVAIHLHFDVSQAFAAAIASAGRADRVLVFGSFLTVGEIIDRYRGNSEL
ncbi:MAG: bifunctional folylpolyglutamate synthase/dihydrofolate synthase [Acidiferrobacterales bacterium]|nr:bifunctional folylpolyglutamate synthase/dihydrofolate synthase [Acidiferrobacterales bacterium]